MQRADSLEKHSDAGEDRGQGEKEVIADEMVGWHHWLNGHESEQTLGDGEGQGSLECCSPRAGKGVGQDLRDWTREQSQSVKTQSSPSPGATGFSPALSPSLTEKAAAPSDVTPPIPDYLLTFVLFIFSPKLVREAYFNPVSPGHKY